MSVKVANKIWGNGLRAVVALMLIGGGQAYAAGAEEMVLKPAVPKFDNAPSASTPHVLKGNIEHHHKMTPPKPRRLNSRADSNGNGLSAPLKGSLDKSKTPMLRQGATTLKSEVQQPYTLERSVGIIGIKFMKMGGEPPLVNRVFPGTPAYKMGFSVNDTIVAVDGVPTYGLTKDECYDLIVGTPNTPITVTLLHRGNFEVKNMMRMDFNEIPDPMVRRDYLNSL